MLWRFRTGIFVRASRGFLPAAWLRAFSASSLGSAYKMDAIAEQLDKKRQRGVTILAPLNANGDSDF
jgi:hypothetical protein